jgi:hypothetical protein
MLGKREADKARGYTACLRSPSRLPKHDEHSVPTCGSQVRIVRDLFVCVRVKKSGT